MTHVGGFDQLSGDAWQTLCLRVLRQHHGVQNLIAIPDDDGGDAGLEAFSLDGCAYQCYAPDRGDQLKTRALYEKHRDKMTADITKFIENKSKITLLIPPDLRISRWVLLIPSIRGRKILEHSKVKTLEVRQADLPYATSDLVVLAHTLDVYEIAMKAVINAQVAKLDLPPIEHLDYSHINDDLIGKMNTKLGMTQAFSNDVKRSDLVGRLLENHVNAEAYLAHIGDNFTEIGDALDNRLDDLEQRLSVHYALDHPVPDRRLSKVLDDTEIAVKEVLNTHDSDSRVIAEGQVADWLMRCPLDFQ